MAETANSFPISVLFYLEIDFCYLTENMAAWNKDYISQAPLWLGMTM